MAGCWPANMTAHIPSIADWNFRLISRWLFPGNNLFSQVILARHHRTPGAFACLHVSFLGCSPSQCTRADISLCGLCAYSRASPGSHPFAYSSRKSFQTISSLLLLMYKNTCKLQEDRHVVFPTSSCC